MHNHVPLALLDVAWELHNIWKREVHLRQIKWGKSPDLARSSLLFPQKSKVTGWNFIGMNYPWNFPLHFWSVFKLWIPTWDGWDYHLFSLWKREPRFHIYQKCFLSPGIVSSLRSWLFSRAPIIVISSHCQGHSKGPIRADKEVWNKKACAYCLCNFPVNLKMLLKKYILIKKDAQSVYTSTKLSKH